MSCTYCNADMHFICVEEALEGKDCCCEGEGFVGEPIKQLLSTKRGRPHITDGSKLADVLTTGRHRAAVRISKEYLAAQHVCSWAGLAAAGGGVVPIIGCPGNIATDRHHGPNKSVLDNDDNYLDFGHNLHAICRFCHARWHGNNDKYYRPEGWVKGNPEPRPPNGEPWFPREPFKYTAHDPITKATDTDIKIHESWWKLRTEEREEIGTFAEWRSQFTVSEDTDDGGLVGIPEPTDYPAIGS